MKSTLILAACMVLSGCATNGMPPPYSYTPAQFYAMPVQRTAAPINCISQRVGSMVKTICY